MTYKIAYLGNPFPAESMFSPLALKNDIIIKMIEKIVSSDVSLGTLKNADLIIVYPYIQWSKWYQLRSRFFVKLWSLGKFSLHNVLTASLGIKNKKAIVVSHENLDRCHWEKFGWLLRESSLPRLTFWPHDLDEKGHRFPYWYNYLQWDNFKRPANCYSRFGVLYDIDKLMMPLREEARLKRAIFITSHGQFPRNEIIRHLNQILPVDVYGKSNKKLNGPKIECMKKYKYCISSENSVGYGYCSEKLPEAWMAGCIPIGCIPQPFSDFNQEACLWDNIQDQGPFSHALLAKRPELTEIENYLANAIHAGH